MSLELDYYYGNEAEQYSFYRIPKALFTDSRFRQVSVEAKVLYGLLLDRMALSVKNGWLDGDGRVYIIFTVAGIMETLGCAEQKANRLLGELDCKKGAGLIERVRRGLGKPNVIYVKNFTGGMAPGPQPRNCENHKSGIAENTNQDLRFSQPNNTDINNTDFSETGLSIHQVEGHKDPERACRGRMDEMDFYREAIKYNIDYDILLEDEPYCRERLEGFVELMAEACSSRKPVRINREDMPVEAVRGRFLKLDSRHVRYVMDCLDKNTTLIGNIRAYTLSALFNAPVTLGQYYASLVSHDMAQGFGGG